MSGELALKGVGQGLHSEAVGPRLSLDPVRKMGAKDAIYKVSYLNIGHVYIFTYHKIEEFDVDFTTLLSDVLVQGASGRRSSAA
eukprot:10470094-Heterocapsa_arctica.AAC.1